MKKHASPTLRLQAHALWEPTSADELIPALIARIPAGEPVELLPEVEMIDLNYLLTKGSPDSLLVRVDGESMCPEIADGDWIIVSRSLRPTVGDIVVASVNGAHTIKRLKQNDLRGRQGLYLVPSNLSLQPREITHADDFVILGIVTRIITDPRRT